MSSVTVYPYHWHRCFFHLRHSTTLPHLLSTHALFLTSGLLLPSPTSTFPLSRLILAASSLSLPYSSLLFHHSPPPPNTFIFNSLILSFSRSPHPHISFPFFLLMLHSPSSPPNHLTFPPLLHACAAVPDFLFGSQLHSLLIKNSLSKTDPFVQTALLRLYVLVSDNLRLARNLFVEIPQRDPVHYDVLMSAYLHGGSPDQAVDLFRCMVRDGIPPDGHVIATVLSACAHAGALGQGVWIHRQLVGEGLLTDTYIGSALVNMYAKCGCIGEAVEVFEGVLVKNSYIWSSMIGGFAMHGLVEEALGCLKRMKVEGTKPDGVVVLNVLAACSHCGMVEKGLKLLSEMEVVYGVAPRHEHYSCAIDMLCRVGRLDEAVGLMREMPMKPMASVWGSLLTSCRTYGNVGLAEVAAVEVERITVEMGEVDEGVYVQLCNIYRNADRREDARRMRKVLGRSRGMKKTAAWSWIEVDGVVSSFMAGDQVHAQRMEIARMLQVLAEEIGYRDCAHDEIFVDCMG